VNVAVVAGFVLAILIEVALPLVLGFYAESKLDVPWRLFGYGALVFAVTQLLLRLPLLGLLGQRLNITAESSTAVVLGWTLFLALTAAVFEEGGRYLGYRFLFRDQRRDWNSAVMYGLGHGGLEAIMIAGLPTVLTLVNVLTIPTLDPVAAGMTAEQAQQLAQAKIEVANLQFWMPLVGALERGLTIAFQVAMSVLVVQVFLRRQWRWLGYALGLHFAVDLVSPLLANYVHVAVAELFVALAAGGAAYWALRLRPQPVEDDTAPRRRKRKPL
jgi:uncharacterized membrane protein YhfC